MKKNHITIKWAVAVFTASSLAFTAAHAGEKDETVSMDSVPAPVAAAIKAEAGEGKVAKIEKSNEDGETTYEATIKKSGKSREVSFSPAGKMVGEEAVVSEAEIPEAVKATIEKTSPGTPLTKVERVQEKGETSYEVVVQMKGKKKEIEISEKGKLMGTEAAEQD